MNLVLIETCGNQAFIFATNKLRENVGASQLTFEVGTKFVLEAVQAAGGRIPQDVGDPQSYPGIDDQNPIEIILAVSGKAQLLVRDAEIGRAIVREVTLRALKEAPGLEVRGVVSEPFELHSGRLHAAIQAVHREFENVRSRLPGPAVRFPRLPIVEECATSGLPAARTARASDGLPSQQQRAYSASTFAKFQARDAWTKRRDAMLKRRGVQVCLPNATTELEELGCDWIAIVHADGNGLGRVFLDFESRARTSGDREYITKLRHFSLALDACTEQAFCDSLGELEPKGEVAPIVPLVLGGDDLTVICDGRQALRFTKRFIEAFETATREHPDIRTILSGGVTSCAGVAITKPHFPFYAGYQLAEDLLQSAKKLAKSDPERYVSALDYHILYDAGGSDLGRIRRELTADGGRTLLVGRPYVVTRDQGPVGRRWSELETRIAAVNAKDEEEGRRRLPNGMLHELRESLFLGRSVADARLRLVLERYREAGLDKLLGDRPNRSLFWKEKRRETEVYRTGLLDAVDTADFWRGAS
ncbi:Cas10/Cmr2 second palm domain-containing protein [Thermopirellula anaerolimosa]